MSIIAFFIKAVPVSINITGIATYQAGVMVNKNALMPRLPPIINNDSWTTQTFEGLILLSLVGPFLFHRLHRCLHSLLVTVPNVATVFVAYQFINSDYWDYCLYTGMSGLLIATIVNSYRITLWLFR